MCVRARVCALPQLEQAGDVMPAVRMHIRCVCASDGRLAPVCVCVPCHSLSKLETTSSGRMERTVIVEHDFDDDKVCVNAPGCPVCAS